MKKYKLTALYNSVEFSVSHAFCRFGRFDVSGTNEVNVNVYVSSNLLFLVLTLSICKFEIKRRGVLLLNVVNK